MKKIFLLLSLGFIAIGCNEIKKEKASEKNEIQHSNLAENHKNLEIGIEGMTCEIGCARTIQSKLSKVEGVSFAEVSFEHKKGQFSYDANIISKDEIVSKITGIGGGDLYAVSEVKEIEEVVELKK